MMIEDIASAERFAAMFCSNFGKDECGFAYMCARKKYDPSLQNGRYGSLDRALIYPDEKMTDVVCKLMQQEHYTKNDTLISKDALICYASLNTRSTKKAAVTLAKYIIDSIADTSKDAKFHTLASRFKTLVHASTGSHLWCTLDVDHKSFLPQVMTMLADYSVTPCCTIETRGGYHVVVPRSSLSNKTVGDDEKLAVREGRRTFGEFVYKHMSKWEHPDDPSKEAVQFMKDGFSPVPGTRQGGFLVRFVD
jgi:hypothetical protein